jgi:hypothetical protein
MRDNNYITTATEATRFNKQLSAALAGALGLPKSAVVARESFQVDTDAGILRGCLCQGSRFKRGVYSPAWVHFRFDDVDAAKRLLPHAWHDRLNGYSGKWNFDFFAPNAEGRAYLLEDMLRNIKGLNPRNPILLDRRG